MKGKEYNIAKNNTLFIIYELFFEEYFTTKDEYEL